MGVKLGVVGHTPDGRLCNCMRGRKGGWLDCWHLTRHGVGNGFVKLLLTLEEQLYIHYNWHDCVQSEFKRNVCPVLIYLFIYFFCIS